MKNKGILILALLSSLLIFTVNSPQLFAQDNLLTNAGFEKTGTDGVAEGWSSWFVDSMEKKDCAAEVYYAQPVWSPELFSSALVREGASSQRVGNQWDPWRGGISQTVDGLKVGQRYQFTVQMIGRVSDQSWPAASNNGYIRGRVGADPNGGSAFDASSIEWGEPVTPRDSWQTATVQAVATSTSMTLFIEGDFGAINNCYPFLDMWFDAAELTAIQVPPPAGFDNQAYLPFLVAMDSTGSP